MSRITLVLKTNEGGLWVIPQIRELARRGHTVTTVIPPGDGRLRRALDVAGFAVVESPFDFNFRTSPDVLSGLAALRRTIRRTAPDVLFYHLYASALAARIASVGLGVPRVHMVAGPLYLESAPIRRAERVLCRLDTHLVAGSDYTAERYRALGMPARRLSAIPYGVDVDRFRPGEDRRVELFGVQPGTFVVIMVAFVYAPKSRVFPGLGVKGHDVLLEAWSRFCPDHPHSLLVLVGGGFDEAGEAHRHRLIERFGVESSSRVRWLESVEDVRPLYASADLSVSPSLSENHGAVLEASAMGLPSIVSDAGALPETVTAETGWVVTAGSVPSLEAALRRAAAAFEAGRSQVMGQTARRHCKERFAHEKVIPQMADTVERVAARTRRRGDLAVFAEQRCWLDADGLLLGRARLGAFESVTRSMRVRVFARSAPPEPVAVPLLADQSAAGLIAWPAGRGDVGALVRTVQQVWRAARPHGAVAVYCPGVLGTVAGFLALIQRKPVIVAAVGNPRDALRPDVAGGLSGRASRLVVTTAMRVLLRRAEVVRYVTRESLQSAYPPGPKARVFGLSDVGALGLAAIRNRPERGPVRLLCVASLDQPYKGVNDLVDAVAGCRAGGHDIRLAVVGTGRIRAALESRARDRLGPSVEFLGHLSRADLQAAYREADCFALASWAEGLPRALVEAMAAGLPAIGTRVGGIPELLEPERTVPPRRPDALASALTDLLKDGAGWARSSRHNIEVARRLAEEAAAMEPAFVAAVLDAVEGRQP